MVKLYSESPGLLLPLLANSAMEYETLSVRQEEDQDYVALIKKHFTPISIGNVTILPPWKESRKAGLKIIIDPGMAFGTGRHESTRIMLRMMGVVELQGKTVLDLGCGSGILAIYAHMMGANRVVAVDHDICSAEAVGKNAGLNSADSIDVICADICDLKGQFDIVLANLDARTFADCSTHIIGLVTKGGLLLTSGIESRQKSSVLPLFSGLERLSQRRMNDWYGFVFRVNDGLSRTATLENT